MLSKWYFLPALLPDDPGFHGAVWKPEEECRVKERHTNPLPELSVVEQLRVLG
jgi:hypothetical protein